MTQADYLTGIAERIQDDNNKLDATTLIACLTQAVAEYSRIRPQMKVEDQTGSGTSFLPLPAGWEAHSRLVSLAQLSSGKPESLPRSEYQLNATPAGTNILRLFGFFESGATYRLSYTARHLISSSASSVPSADAPALMDLAASYAALRLSAAYTQEENANLGTVTIERKSKADSYRALAAELRKSFETSVTADERHIGAGQMKTWYAPRQAKMFH